MGFIAKVTRDYLPAPAGSFSAVCTMMVDLGLQPGFDASQKPAHSIYVQWELPTERLPDQPDMCFAVGKRYRLSLHKQAALRQMLETWRGRAFTETELAGFDVSTIIAKPCLVNTVHQPNTQGDMRAKITSVTPLPKGMAALEPVSIPLVYDLDQPNPQTFTQLPSWLQEVINSRVQPVTQKPVPPPVPAAEFDYDDDLPF